MTDKHETLKVLGGIVGDHGVVREEDTEPYLNDRRGYYRGEALCIVRPANTAEVSEVVSDLQTRAKRLTAML